MKKRKAIKLSVVTFVCIILAGLIIHHMFYAKHIATPDKIIIYNNGTKTELTKDNSSFNKIVSYMNARIRSDSHVAKLGIPENWEEDIKNDELGVEFIYSKEQSFSDSVFKQYTRLFFPVKSNIAYNNYENLMFFSDEGQYGNGPIGVLPCSSELTNLLKMPK